MAKQILFLKKNKLDIDDPVVVLTASQGNDFVNFLRNRNNTSAWVTNGSVDADLTTLEVNFMNEVALDHISLVKCNFKSYKIEYWNGASYVTFSPAIDETANTNPTPSHNFTKVNSTKIRLTVRGTMTANIDKKLYQLIASEKIGTGYLNGWPIIKNPTISRQRAITPMLSGKRAVKEQIGFFSCDLEVKVYSDNGDLTIFEYIYSSNYGVLVQLCGGDEDQFSSKRYGYRKEDFFLMKPSDEYTVEWYKGFYKSGQVVNIKLVESKD